jgi:hypothetical protein
MMFRGRREPVRWLTRVGQWAGFVAPLARGFVDGPGVDFRRPYVESILRTRGALRSPGQAQIPQVRETVLRVVHQAVAFQEISVAIHRATPKANSKDQNYRLTFRCRTTENQDRTTETDCRTTECERFVELFRFRQLLRFYKAGTRRRFVTVSWAAKAAAAATLTPR